MMIAEVRSSEERRKKDVTPIQHCGQEPHSTMMIGFIGGGNREREDCKDSSALLSKCVQWIFSTDKLYFERFSTN